MRVDLKGFSIRAYTKNEAYEAVKVFNPSEKFVAVDISSHIDFPVDSWFLVVKTIPKVMKDRTLYQFYDKEGGFYAGQNFFDEIVAPTVNTAI